MASLQRSLLGGGEPTLDVAAPTERVDLDDCSWVPGCAKKSSEPTACSIP